MQLRHGKNRAALLQKREYMNSMGFPRIKNTGAVALGANYNYQHLVFVTKYRNAVFNDAETIRTCKTALEYKAMEMGVELKLLSFGDDYAHIHLYVNLPNTMTVADFVQRLKGVSAHELLKQIPRLRKDFFWGGHFWGKHYGSRSVGPQDQEVVEAYIKRQDISGRFLN